LSSGGHDKCHRRWMTAHSNAIGARPPPWPSKEDAMIGATEHLRAVGDRPAAGARAVGTIGEGILRYGLAFFLLGGGLSKFSEFEAQAIQPWVAHSPFMGWLYGVTSLQGAANLIGVVEIALAVLLAVGRWLPGLSAVGSFGATAMFLITLSFLFT